jgi:PhzF family phenazine biosynthesis protein
VAQFEFHQVDVFTSKPLCGNALAVVLGADSLSDAQMAAFANWTNLSETTFLLRPTVATADYRVRIFTPHAELPFAGHPTLGTCHVWLGRNEPRGEEIIQECPIGLVRVRRSGEYLSFAAPPLRRSGAIEPELLDRIRRGLGLGADDIVASNWVENGPDWTGIMLRSRAAVMAVKPNYGVLAGQRVGIVGAWDPDKDGTDVQFEVRAFTAGGYEDPVTGSLNAGLAQWLIGSGIAPPTYVASQGSVLGRAGRVHVETRGSDIWIGGAVASRIRGTVTL